MWMAAFIWWSIHYYFMLLWTSIISCGRLMLYGLTFPCWPFITLWWGQLIPYGYWLWMATCFNMWWHPSWMCWLSSIVRGGSYCMDYYIIFVAALLFHSGWLPLWPFTMSWLIMSCIIRGGSFMWPFSLVDNILHGFMTCILTSLCLHIWCWLFLDLVDLSIWGDGSIYWGGGPLFVALLYYIFSWEMDLTYYSILE